MISFRFPESFIWGTACSSFQVEGAANIGGKGASILDRACADYPERFSNATPDIASDFYHRYREDIAQMKELGLQSFRLSIAWPRLLPTGTGEANQEGVDFYNAVFDCLMEHGIEPLVDLYHWDLPQALQEKGGFENPDIIAAFEAYAELCFKLFGDRVKRWSTFNEPSVVILSGYGYGGFPPYKDSLEGSMLATQNLLLAHYAAIRKYRAMQMDGKIGAVIAFVPVYPNVPGSADDGAAIRQEDIVCNWWLRPMFYGEYPESILCDKEHRDAMPRSCTETLRAAFEPMDYVGINYYYPSRTAYCPDSRLQSKPVKVYYGQSDYGFAIYAPGLYDSLHYVRENYGNPEVYLTENGLGNLRLPTMEEEINDENRIEFLREHFRQLNRAIQSGCNVRGYYYWSHMDDFTGEQGYNINFGLIHLDRETLKRTPRKSWHFYKACIEGNRVD